MKKTTCVLLYDEAVSTIGLSMMVWIHRSTLGTSINCKEIDASGPHFLRMIVETGAPDVKPVDFELMLPYSAVKAIFSAADISSLGFVTKSPKST